MSWRGGRRTSGSCWSTSHCLVMDGAAAESYLYTDPDAAMAKARRFTETLAQLLVSRTQVRVHGATQDARIKALTDAGVLVPSSPPGI